MSGKTMFCSILLAVLACAVGSKPLAAQEAGSTSKPAAQEQETPAEAFRLDFLLSEMEDGKRINSRQFSMNIKANDSGDIKIGTRVPVEAKGEEFQYLDVGTNVDASLKDRRGQMELFVRAENSSLVPAGQGAASDYHPMVRQMLIKASTIVLHDKPMLIGVAEDPNSKRQFQLEVTVTKLK